MELKDIKELIALIRKNDLSEFSLEQEGFKITLKREAEFVPVVTTAPQVLPAPVALPAAAPAATGPAAAVPVKEGKDIPSPMVGTFYSCPAPDSPPFVSLGQQVTPDTTICIIEAMKVMNEIKAEVSGTIVEILAEDAKPVQYGQALFRIR